MTISDKKEPLILFLGDIAVFFSVLWVTLFIRYSSVPESSLFFSHLVPFSAVIILWIFVFFIAGLYEKHTRLLKSRLPTILLKVQMLNSVIAVLFFYFIPYFGINPKTNLFIYLVLSFFLILTWRLFGSSFIGFKYREKAILVGSGKEVMELYREINGNSKYSIYFDSFIDLKNINILDLENDIFNKIKKDKISTIVIDFEDDKVEPIISKFYSSDFSGINLFDMYKVYEDTFDRIPLSLLNQSRFLGSIYRSAHAGYDFMKRAMDVTIGLILGLVSLVFYPFVILAIKIEGDGGIFSYQERVGQNNEIISIVKFRTMTLANDEAKWGSVENKVTKIGAFLRKSRIDELPQLWNVLKGDISLIGPRPEFERPVREYSEKIPYYNTRHIIKPGLSGWAQLYHERHPHHGVDIEETRNKLSYDLYYIKNRSLMLDLEIALKTTRTLLSRTGV
jgi:exopolysaccharide biosynthesis polyprenyl glycosylphosphotransferase